MSKCTQGEWTVLEIENKYHAGSHHEGNKTIVTVATIICGEEVIARCGSIEDAKQIVINHNAAPKLLEALEAIEANNSSDALVIKMLGKQIKAAIAAAKGEV